MKMDNLHMYTQKGFTLLEVVLAIAVFAFGMLALVQLQTGVARSSSDANTRTVASNIAEEMVEDARGFTQISADSTNGRIDYNEIVTYGSPQTVQRGNLDYTVNVRVQPYYWDADSESFTTTQPTGIVNSDYKTMDIVVMWRGLQGGETFNDHDSIDFGAGGGVRLVEAIPSTPALLGALVAAEREVVGSPTVDYNPGENPDIVRLTLDDTNHKFKESTSAMPDVIRSDAVETWFDVVTYSQVPTTQAIFLRREEFAAVSCTCELNTNPTDAEYGRKPTIWNGVDYTEGALVDKPIGVEPNNISQSFYCGVCCRDHHDGAGNGPEDVYNPDDAGGLDADHDHYARDRRGMIVDTPIGNGDEYVEACRLIRKDGFMRVAQDARQCTLIGFPEGYLELTSGAQAYSDYVIDAVSDYYGSSPPPDSLLQPDPPTYSFPARATDDPTNLPTPTLHNYQQMRSRAVYTDYLGTAAQTVISECFPPSRGPGDDPPDNCPAKYATSPLELYPFFEVQMTKLARWLNISYDANIAVTNDPIATNNTHSRGLASLISDDGQGQSQIEIASNKGNLGLTATGPINPVDGTDASLNKDILFVDARLDSTPAPALGFVVTGPLSSAIRRVRAADLSLTPSSGVLCGQTDTQWSCVTAAGGTVTVGNYYLNNPTVYVCSDLGAGIASGGTSVVTATTTFTLPGSAPGPNVTFGIWVSDQPCTP